MRRCYIDAITNEMPHSFPVEKEAMRLSWPCGGLREMRADSDSDAENDCDAYPEDEDIARVKSKAMKAGQAALNVR